MSLHTLHFSVKMKATTKCNTYFVHKKQRVEKHSPLIIPQTCMSQPSIFPYILFMCITMNTILLTNDTLHRLSVHIFSQTQAYLLKTSERNVLYNEVSTQSVTILTLYRPVFYFQVTSNFIMFAGMLLTLFLHKPKLLESYNLLLRYKLGFPSIIPFQ
jgi:hypothetical protein